MWMILWGGLTIMYLNDGLTVGRGAALVFFCLALQYSMVRLERVKKQPSDTLEATRQREERLIEQRDALIEEIDQVKKQSEVYRHAAVHGIRFDKSLPPGTAAVKLSTMKELRNLLLKHHEGRRTDAAYCESSFAKQTNDIVSALNGFLEKK